MAKIKGKFDVAQEGKPYTYNEILEKPYTNPTPILRDSSLMQLYFSFNEIG